MTEHVTNTTSSCAQALYALRMLNSQGLNQASLQLLFSAIILAKLQYASPAWIGFASASDINKLDSFLARSKRSGFCSTNLPPFEVLSESADSGLFRAITQNPGHVLHRLLPPKKPTTYNMRYARSQGGGSTGSIEPPQPGRTPPPPSQDLKCFFWTCRHACHCMWNLSFYTFDIAKIAFFKFSSVIQ